MITNLVFKRTANLEGSNRTEMKIIEVMIPELKSNEGWTLVSSADKVDQIKIQECRAIPHEIANEQAEEDAAIAEFLKNYRAEKEEKREKLMRQLACSCSGKPDPSITAHNGCECEVIYDQYTKPEVDAKVAEAVANIENFKENAANSVDVTVKTPKKPAEYPSPVSGTACLIRRNNTIRIAYREGKKANINTPNKVCISDKDKQHFFNAVRAANACTDIFTSWSLDKNSHHYDTWNKFIDDEYISQREEHLRRTTKR